MLESTLKLRLLILQLLLFIIVALPISAVSLENKSVSISTKNKTIIVAAEVADTPASMKHGLMDREHLAEDSGMLFDFPQTQVVKMWMKNTKIPLDMLFVSENGEIKYIKRLAKPQSLEIISSKVPVRYVLEVNAGFADRHGIAEGDRMGVK